ncbi:MAG TPA: hypothetical protein VGG41_18685 [Solirubrobacteraceae bacterium]
MIVAHLSNHGGLIADFECVAAVLDLDVRSFRYDDGYNIGPERAERSWERWRERLASADVVLVSDTAPLARIVLERLEEFAGHVVLWVCNRFDYSDQATNDCGFPDPGYYELIRRCVDHERVHIAPYSAFEIEYARDKGVELGERLIKPLGRRRPEPHRASARGGVDRAATVYVPPYHNDTIFMDLAARCEALGVPAWCGRYSRLEEVSEFRAVVHIPYAWSTVAFFERLQAAIPTFIPSARLLLEMWRQPNFFWPDSQRLEELLTESEWYAPEHEGLLVQFDSFEELGEKLHELDLEPVCERLREFGERHAIRTSVAWSALFDEIEHDSVRRLRPYKELLERHTEVDGDQPSRFASFSFAFEHVQQTRARTVVELGTTRSYVHGGLAGCNDDDPIHWRPDAPERWDWGAGAFTLLAALCLPDCEIHTVDTASSHIERAKVMTAAHARRIRYHVCDSVDFLRSWGPGTLDLVYLDTGDMWPIEPTARHQLAEAQVLCEERLLSGQGLLLIDDIGNPTPGRFGDDSPHGKAKYSLPYLLEQGFEVVFEGFQLALRPPARRT